MTFVRIWIRFFSGSTTLKGTNTPLPYPGDIDNDDFQVLLRKDPAEKGGAGFQPGNQKHLVLMDLAPGVYKVCLGRISNSEEGKGIS